MYEKETAWLEQPNLAFAELLVSDQFRASNRSSTVLPINHRIQKGSARVYISMFDKFLRHLNSEKQDLLNVDSTGICSFFDSEMSKASSETRLRYSRLTERVFSFLCTSKFRSDNPVSTWMKQRGALDTRPGVTRSDGPSVTAAEIARLQDWLHTVGSNMIEIGDWRAARDITLASLSLGTGMRCSELILLTKRQVKYWPGGPVSSRFEFDIPGWASVATARSHNTLAHENCVILMERWWAARWNGVKNDDSKGTTLLAPPKGDQVFPSTLSGKQLTASTLYKNIKSVAADGVQAGALKDSTRWVLERGAQGLRRAYVLTSLEQGVPYSTLTDRLGHHDDRSIRKYLKYDDEDAAFS